MTKLLNAYKTCNSLKNAKKLRDYTRSHPMAQCMLTVDDNHILEEAIRLAEREM